MTGRNPDEADSQKDMPRYIAIQADGSTQPAFMRIGPDGETVFEVGSPKQWVLL